MSAKVSDTTQILQVLGSILAVQSSIFQLGANIMATLDELVTEVAKVKGVEDSATVALNGLVAQVKTLAAQLAAQGQDTTKINQMIADLEASTAPLAAAIATNPPATGGAALPGATPAA